MAEYPKIFKNKYGKVTIYRSRNTRGDTSFKIRWRRGKLAFEEKKADETQANERAREIFEQIEYGEKIMSKVDQEKIAYYVTCEQMLEGRVSLMDAVREWLKQQPKIASLPMKEAADKYLESMESRGLSREHIAPVCSRLKKFLAAMPEQLEEVDTAKVAEYLNGFENLQTRKNERTALNRFFNWCRAHGILPREAKHAVEGTDIPKVKWAEPEIIDPHDLAKVLWVIKTVYPEIVVPVILGAFGGLRRAEIQRLKFEDIDMEQGIITLSAKITKTNLRRIVGINSTLRAWLTQYLRPDQDFQNPNYEFMVRRCVKYVKATWPVNGLRHSFISYRVQHVKNTAEVALEAGHSVMVLLRHYKCLCTPEMAERWFNVLPDTTNLGMDDMSGVEKE